MPHKHEHAEHGELVARWERRVEVPMLLLAGAFLIAYAWPILDPSMAGDLLTGLNVMSWAVWAAFAVDFGIRLTLAEKRLKYALRHWYDVLLILLPMVRTLRLFRLLSLIRLINRSMVGALVGRVSVYVTGASVLTIMLGALAVLDAEQDVPGANITTFGDALWWAIVTATTVGYGDFYPVTVEGRLIAVALMLTGIALVGVVTAAVASWFISSVKADEDRKKEKEEEEQENAPSA